MNAKAKTKWYTLVQKRYIITFRLLFTVRGLCWSQKNNQHQQLNYTFSPEAPGTLYCSSFNFLQLKNIVNQGFFSQEMTVEWQHFSDFHIFSFMTVLIDCFFRQTFFIYSTCSIGDCVNVSMEMIRRSFSCGS